MEFSVNICTKEGMFDAVLKSCHSFGMLIDYVYKDEGVIGGRVNRNELRTYESIEGVEYIHDNCFISERRKI